MSCVASAAGQRPVVLVANRGEIACRILRGLRGLGWGSVAVYTPPDAGALHTTLADVAVPLADPGGYMDAAALVAAARQAGATAVHPGYGFLSQSPAFVRACVAANLVFVGPSAASMEQVGDKRAARRLAQRLQIPVVPGAESVEGEGAVRAFASKEGYPLLVKAAAAGGGRGLRRINGEGEVAAAVQAAAREAHASVGDGRLLVERWLTNVRHVEVQVVGDGTRARAVGDRECSLQRRFQKVVEEGPASTLSPSTRQRLHAAGEKLLTAAAYLGAGTVEFLLQDDGTFYFLEVNPRLQVEHPVTEATCQLDLVALQLRLALGWQDLADFVPPAVRGHAIEVRLNAEDCQQNFVPVTGEVLLAHWPQGPGVRCDAGVAEGSQITPHYDPLLAKIVAWGEDRAVARRRLVQAVEETALLGLPHNQGFLLHLLRSDAFCQARTYTTTLEAMAVPVPPALPGWLLAAVAEAAASGPQSAAAPAEARGDGGEVRGTGPWQQHDGWRNQ